MLLLASNLLSVPTSTYYCIFLLLMQCFPESDDQAPAPVPRSTSHYYLLPCYFLFYRSDKLLNLVLNRMGSSVTEKKSSLSSCVLDHSSWINPIVSVVLLMHKDVKIRRVLSSCKAEIQLILDNILVVQVPLFPSNLGDYIPSNL